MTSDGVVYVIDDDPTLRRALARLVEAAGFEVETFPSAEAFLGQPIPDRPACLVLDVRLPGDSGLDLQAALGSARRLLPIIFLTGHGTVSAGIRAMKGGAVDFLEKPVDENELLGGIRELRVIEEQEHDGASARLEATVVGSRDSGWLVADLSVREGRWRVRSASVTLSDGRRIPIAGS